MAGAADSNRNFWVFGTGKMDFWKAAFVTSSSQLLLTVGFQCETAGRGSMAMYTQVAIKLISFSSMTHMYNYKIIFATILERMFFHTHPTPYSVTGIILISGSALYIAVSFKFYPKF